MIMRLKRSTMPELKGFLTPPQVSQMLNALTSVQWSPLNPDRATPSPAEHGALTGQLCGFFSQPVLLRQLNDQFAAGATNFAGNFERVDAGSHCIRSVAGGVLGLVVVLKGSCVAGDEPLHAGDAYVQKGPLSTVSATKPSIWIRGDFCAPP